MTGIKETPGRLVPPGRVRGGIELSRRSARTPAREAGQALRLADVDAGAAAQHVLPDQGVACTTGVVWPPVWSRGLRETAQQGRLERPQVRAHRDVWQAAHRRAPRGRELGPRGAVAVVAGNVSGLANSVVPTLDEATVYVAGSRAGFSIGLDVDHDEAALRDTQAGGRIRRLDCVAVASLVIGDVRAVVVVVDGKDAHVVACGERDLARAYSRANRVRQVATPEVRRAEGTDDGGIQLLAGRVAGEGFAGVHTPQELRGSNRVGFGLDVDQTGGGRSRCDVQDLADQGWVRRRHGADDRGVGRRRPPAHPRLHAARRARLASVVDKVSLLVVDSDDPRRGPQVGVGRRL